ETNGILARIFALFNFQFPISNFQFSISLLRARVRGATASPTTATLPSALILISAGRSALTTLATAALSLTFNLNLRSGNQTQLTIIDDLLARFQSLFYYSHRIDGGTGFDGARVSRSVRFGDPDKRFVLTDLHRLRGNYRRLGRGAERQHDINELPGIKPAIIVDERCFQTHRSG